MGLLDALTSIAGGASSEHHGMADALSQVMQEHPGGMDGILNQLKQNGLGEQVQSWVSPGENKAISPEQVQQGLSGSGLLEQAAEKAGVSPQVAAMAMSTILPMVMQHFGSGGAAQAQAQGQSPLGGIAQQLLGKFL